MSDKVWGGSLRKLNSATKYGSIETYHKLGPTGVFEGTLNGLPETSEQLIVTEKVNGANARIVLLPGTQDFLIGSREDILYARGDRIITDAAHGLVRPLIETAEAFSKGYQPTGDQALVLYGEFYGLKTVPGYKAYGDGTKSGWRVFDAARIPAGVLDMNIEDIALWRDSGKRQWLDEKVLWETITSNWLVAHVDIVPRLCAVDSQLYSGHEDDLPLEVAKTHEWLKKIVKATHADLTPGGTNKAEGVVVRNYDRSWVRKIRFEDYERWERQQDPAYGRRKKEKKPSDQVEAGNSAV